MKGIFLDCHAHFKTRPSNPTYKVDISSRTAPNVGVKCDHDGVTSIVVIVCTGW